MERYPANTHPLQRNGGNALRKRETLKREIMPALKNPNIRKRNKRDHGNAYYVYTLTDPRNGEMFYVGKGIKNRAHDHMTEARRGGTPTSNTNKLQRILDIESSGNSVVVTKLRDGLGEAEAFAVEYVYIRENRATLLNCYDKGVPAEERMATYYLREWKVTPSPEQWWVSYTRHHNALPSLKSYLEYRTVYRLFGNYVRSVLEDLLAKRNATKSAWKLAG